MLIRKDSFRILHILMLIMSIFILVTTYIAEYIMDIQPCNLCIYQRFTYLYIIKISISSLFKKKFTHYNFLVLIICCVVSCLLSGYNILVERNIIFSTLCSNIKNIPNNMSIDEIQQMLYSETFVACNEIAVKIVGLSMAEWNFFLNFMLIFFLLIIYFYNKFEKIYLEISNDSTNNQS